MAKNVLSLQLLRNSTLFNSKEAAYGAFNTGTNDGVIKLARYTEDNVTKTIFGIYHAFEGNSGYTIYESYKEAIDALQAQVDSLESGSSEAIDAIMDILGTGVTSANTVSGQLSALSGSTADTSGSTSVEGAKKYADGKIAGAIEALDYAGPTTGDGKVVVNVTEDDGIVEATVAEVGGLKLTDYSKGSSSDAVANNDTINQAISKLENQVDAAKEAASTAISGLDYSDSAVAGEYVSQVTETDGIIAVTRVALPTVAAISESGKPITAVSESLGAISATAGTIDAQYVTITDSDNHYTATTVEGALAEVVSAYTDADEALKTAIVGGASDSANTLAKLEGLINGLDADAATYTIRKDTADLPATVKERYTLVETKNGTSTDKQVAIDIPKDSHIVSIDYIDDPQDEHYQNLEYVYVNDSGATSTTYVDMSALVLEAEFASGVTVGDGHVVHGVVDTTSEPFLTVGADGFKLSGVQAAIDNAVSGATAQTAELSAKTVTEIASSNSSISATTGTATDGTVSVDLVTDASKVKMTGFTADASGFTAITTASTVTEAIKAIETEVIANEQVVAAALNDLELTKLDNIVVNSVSGSVSNNVASVTIEGDDLHLSANYAKAQTNTAVATGDSVDVAIGKLEKQIEVATAGGLQVVESGSAISVSAVSNNRQTISVVLADPTNVTGIDENAIKVNNTDNGLYIDTLDCGFYD